MYSNSSHARDNSSSLTASSFDSNRDSRMVRASVLDAALELGIGGPNSTVADWIFNNPVTEEEEGEEEEKVSILSYPVYFFLY